ncbi:unnamed protein product [Lactuca saligna]|uniref:Uncharacterized protein n=1 Tax=Lactuca saligna TaxID=75948 RepID=A0AA36A4L6_LACSI|nr:unnamed protein product [Lactuca saligna]
MVVVQIVGYATWWPSGKTSGLPVVPTNRMESGDQALVPSCIVVMAECSVMMDGSHHKLAMNSVVEPTGGLIGVCVSSFPSTVDGQLSSRDCIGLTRLFSSPSCRIGPLSVISGV